MLKIFTSTCSRPDLIELQLTSFLNHLMEPFELTVFNNSFLDFRYEVEYGRINAACKRLGVTCIPVERDLSLIAYCRTLETYPIFRSDNGVYWGPNSAAQYADNWIWKHYISKERGPILLIHPDVFLVQPWRPSDWLTHQICYIPQSRPGAGEYMHDAVVLADVSRLPNPENINWSAGRINGVDVDGGGQTHFWLKAHPELDTFHIGIQYPVLPGRDAYPPPDYEMFQFGAVPEFLHYRTVSNWNHMSDHYHREKTAWLKKILEGQ